MLGRFRGGMGDLLPSHYARPYTEFLTVPVGILKGELTVPAFLAVFGKERVRGLLASKQNS
jgi:hypothetical protein